MWPILLDMTKDECRRMLRRLELEAYGSLVSALRAQGNLSSDKHKVLLDIATTLNITPERHRAEVRRAVNDEKLTTIALCITGDDSTEEWAVEGRRAIPLMPRIVPQTAYSVIADDEANKASADNEKLPLPCSTERKRTLQVNVSENKTLQYRTQPEQPSKMVAQNPNEEPPTIKKRRTLNMEGSSLAKHLMMAPPKVTRLQQIYRQKTKAMLKLQPKKEPSNNKPTAKHEEPITETPKDNKMPNPIAIPNDNQPKNVLTSPKPAVQNIKAQHTNIPVSEMSKSIKICPARKVITTSAKTLTTPQKLIIVSTSQGTPTSSILQRTLTIPFVKTISMKNLDKVTVISTTTVQMSSAISNQKPKLLTVQAKMKSGTPGKTVNIPFIQGVQLQALQSKGAIKMLPLSSTAKNSTSNSLYIVNSSTSMSGVTTLNTSPIMTSKAQPSMDNEQKNAKNFELEEFNSQNKQKREQKSSVLAEILKASGVITSTEVDLYQEPDIENEITQFTPISKSNSTESIKNDHIDESIADNQEIEQFEQNLSLEETELIMYPNSKGKDESIEGGESTTKQLGSLDPDTGYVLKEKHEKPTTMAEPDDYVMHIRATNNEFDMPALNIN